MRNTVLFGVLNLSLLGCGSSNDTGGGSGGAGAGGSSATPVAKALHTCLEGTSVAKPVFLFTSDRQNLYWTDISGTNWVFLARSKSDGSMRTVSTLPAGDLGVPGAMLSAAARDASIGHVTNLLADDHDDYLYYSGLTQVWRVKKDGSEEVQPVSGIAISALGMGACNFGSDRLTATQLVACRHGEIFRMPRATGGQATSVYTAPAGTTIDALDADDAFVYLNGPYSTTRHLAPILKISMATGESTELGQMIEGLQPDAIFLVGQNLVFDSLAVGAAPDLATEGEWDRRQGSYRIGLAEDHPTKISEVNISLVEGAAADATHVYTLFGRGAVRIPVAGGVTETFVDCSPAAAGDASTSFRDVVVDEQAVYLRDGGEYFRYSK